MTPETPPQPYDLDHMLKQHGSLYFPTEYYDSLDEKTRTYLESSGKYRINKKDFGLTIAFA